MSVLGNSLLLAADAAPTAYQVSRSLRFNGSVDNSYLSRTPGSAGNRKTWTFSCWVKRSGLGTTQRVFSSSNSANTQGFYFEIKNGDTFDFYDYSDPTLFWRKTTTQVFRDTGAWFHLQLAFDSTNATAGDRIKLYINGVLVTAFSISSDPSLNYDSYWNAARVHAIGRTGDCNAGYFDGYLADIHFIDGQALTPSSFAETDATTGQWVPKLYSGSYGTNGFKLTFADNSNNTASTLGADTSGNGNHWSPTNLSVTAGAGSDALTDTPTSYGSGTSGGDVRGNFCTWNPLKGATTFANGNLEASTTTGGSQATVGTVGMYSGKWYWEVTLTVSGTSAATIGIATNSFNATNYVGNDAGSWGYYSYDGSKYNNGSSSSYGATYGNGDVIGVAFDADNGNLYFYKNGTAQNSGTAAYTSLTSGPYFPAVGDGTGSGAFTFTLNAGQRAFAFTPPTNFKPLVDTYLPTPTVAKPSEVMDITLYTGNGSARSITGFSFSPDFVWIKNRSNATGHRLLDTVRGATKALISQGTDAEVTESQGLTAFNSDGFSLGTGAFDYNQSGNTYVGWCWDAGTSTVTNTQGSISSQVRANPSAGFSIVSWTGNGSTGATVGHGLVTPGLIILKNRDDSTYQWPVWHSYYGTSTTSKLVLSRTDSTITGDTNGYVTSINSTTFGFGGGTAAVNANGQRIIAYVFSPVSGYSSFGTYTGTGTSDNSAPFIWTGFRPRWILIKRTDLGGSANYDWSLYDTSRDTYNLATKKLTPNSSVQEGYDSDSSATDKYLDILSSGFKIRVANAGINASGGTFLYACFAESPFQYARAR